VPILKAVDGGKETEDKDVSIFQAWPRQVEITLAIALILQVAFFAVWMTATAPASLAYLLIALAAFAMGLQANAIRFLNVPGISTTAFTATYVDLASGLASWGLTRPSARRLGRDRGRRGRRRLPRRLDAQARPPLRTDRASGRNSRRHRDRLGRLEAACHLRPGPVSGAWRNGRQRSKRHPHGGRNEDGRGPRGFDHDHFRARMAGLPGPPKPGVLGPFRDWSQANGHPKRAGPFGLIGRGGGGALRRRRSRRPRSKNNWPAGRATLSVCRDGGRRRSWSGPETREHASKAAATYGHRTRTASG
jgi:hypothetical protein